jgi:hypothetical protein
MVTRALLAATLLASLGGCMIQANSSRNPTLPYHTDHRSLERAAADIDQGFAAPAPRPVGADLHIEDLVGYYPDMYGLEFTSDGVFRKIRTAWLMPGADHVTRPEQRLTGAARQLLPGLGGKPVLLTGALVELAVYKYGPYNVAGAAVELRVVVAGQETYTARYRISAKTRRSDQDPLDTLWPALEAGLMQQITGDDALIGAVDAGGKS